MNASVRLFMNDRRFRLAASAGACALTAACVTFPAEKAAVDPTTNLGPDIARAEQASGAYPSFRDIPAIPKDIRSDAAYARAAGEVNQALAQLEADTAPNTWTLEATDSFAAGEQARFDRAPVPGAAEAAATEAFARRLRERATPPPLPR